ncbi:hypothetical protein [Streptomyces sp. NPDC052292]|uniref:hypothetical protein n=1 Tax=Streptomyces sp. NPDC052292 TaxID=3155053 RepID=UPI0034339520
MPPDELEPPLDDDPPDVELPPVPEPAAAGCAVTVTFTLTLTVFVTVGAGFGFAVSVAVAVAVTVAVAVGRTLSLATVFVASGFWSSAPALPTPMMNARPKAGSTNRLRAHLGAGRTTGGPGGG